MKSFILSLLFISLCAITQVSAFQSAAFHKSHVLRTTNTFLNTLTTRSIDVKLETMNTSPSSTRLQWNKDGYKFWNWNGLKVHYVDLGKCDSNSKPPLLLVHGFGASVYHWRYNIPALSEKYHVYALDLVGFGLSDKPLIDYDAAVWRDQILAFIKEVVHQPGSSKAPCVVCGNSLGGFAVLAAASANSEDKDLIRGCVLLNGAGRFRGPTAVPVDTRPSWLIATTTAIQKFVIGLTFVYTKQPARVEQILKQVYVNPSNVDAELVESIIHPSKDENAAEVYYRIVSRNGNGPLVFVDDLLEQLKVPLLLLWGDKDPWITPAAADKIQALYPGALRVDVSAGHCPHDEAPEDVNREISRFVDNLPAF